MEQKITNVIVLRSLPFKDHQKIVTAFSKEFGMISLLVKGLASKKNFKLPFCESFCEAELVLSKKRGDLFTLIEGSIISLHISLREELRYLNTASSMAKAILESQLSEKPSPLLYSLFSACLHQMPNFSCLNTLLSCFYLKILKHEGVFPFFTQESSLSSLSENEIKKFIDISETKKFSKLKEKTTSLSELKKLEKIFLTQIKG